MEPAEILEDFPDLEAEDIRACLASAAALTGNIYELKHQGTKLVLGVAEGEAGLL